MNTFLNIDLKLFMEIVWNQLCMFFEIVALKNRCELVLNHVLNNRCGNMFKTLFQVAFTLSGRISFSIRYWDITVFLNSLWLIFQKRDISRFKYLLNMFIYVYVVFGSAVEQHEFCDIAKMAGRTPRESSRTLLC